jgi:hypothetical protein
VPGAVYNSWSEVVGPTVLRAESIAAPIVSALASGATGRVHSLFRRAVNLRMDDGTLLAVLARAPGRVPNGVHVDDEIDFLDPPLGLAVGAAVRVIDGVLVLADELRVDLRWAPPWPLDLERVTPTAARQLDANRRVARRRIVPEPILVEPAAALVAAARALAPAATDAAVGALIGRGPGLTPAGDDLLLGLLAVLEAAEHPAAPMVAHALVGAVGEPPPPHRRARGAPAGATTSDVSAALLRLAAVGQHAELVARLAVSLLAGDELDVDAALDGLLIHASASSRSAAYGAMLGLEVVARARRPTPDARVAS